MASGAAKVIPNEVDISSRAASTRGVYLAMVVPAVRGPLKPFLATSPEDFLARYTEEGRIKVAYDTSLLEVLTAFQFTDKIWVNRAARNALNGGAFIRSGAANGTNLPAEFGFVDPSSDYDLSTKDGRPQVADSPISVDSDQELFTVSAGLYSMIETGDTVTLSSTGTLPIPLSNATTYYAVKSSITNKVGLATSTQNANLGLLIDIQSFGTGDQTLTVTNKAKAGSFTVDTTTDTLTVNGLVYAAAATGDAVTLTTTAVIPGGLATSTTYYVIKGATNSFKLAASLADAQAGIPIDVTSSGSGTNTLTFTYKDVSSIGVVDMSDDTITVNDNFYRWVKTGDKVRLVTSTGVLPGNLDTSTDYYAIKLSLSNKVKLASSSNNASNGTAIEFENPGSGTVLLSNRSIELEDSNEDKVLLIYGADPGLWNNNLSIKITNYATNPTKVKEPDSFLLEVYQGNKIVETWPCSRNPDKRDGRGQTMYIEDVLQGSLYIRAINNVAIDFTVPPKDQLTLLALNGGSNGDAMSDSIMIDALAPFESKDEFPIAIVNDSGWTTPTYQNAIISLCETRGDCAFVFAPPFSAEAAADFITAIVDYKEVTLNSVSSYGGMWTSHLLIEDADNSRQLYIAPSAHVSGKIAYTWDRYEPWAAAAGNKRGVLNVLGVHRVFTEGQMDRLYDSNINPIRWKRGAGTRIWGQKTLQSRPSDLDRMNARLLLCVIKPAIAELLEDFIFDFATVENDSGTRAAIRAAISNYMDSVKARNGVYDYQVICDTRNNKAADIENNTVRVWLLVKIMKTIEYIPFDLGITRYGMDFKLAESVLETA